MTPQRSFSAGAAGQLGAMIARIWRGAVRAQDASAYADYVQRTGIEGYKSTAGNRGAWLLWRVEGDRAEFVTMCLWESRSAIEAFAGQVGCLLSGQGRVEPDEPRGGCLVEFGYGLS